MTPTNALVHPQPVLCGAPPKLRIKEVECHVLLASEFDVTLTSSAQDGIVVFIRTGGDVSEIGETDANPWMVKACIEAPGPHTMGRGIAELLGSDLFDIADIARRLYRSTAMNGRRGVIVDAIGALDMALWDFRGKAVGKPVHALLGGSVRDYVIPDASLQPEERNFEQCREALKGTAERAGALGFRAMKAEITMAGPYAHGGMNESYDRHSELLAAVHVRTRH